LPRPERQFYQMSLLKIDQALGQSGGDVKRDGSYDH
jgi:hypothetical protein